MLTEDKILDIFYMPEDDDYDVLIYVSTELGSSIGTVIG